jgi:putative ABC transport system permease protein
MDSRGFSQAIVISFDVWRNVFHADPSVVGQEVEVPGLRAPFGAYRSLIGVMPPGFEFPQGTNVWAGRSEYGGVVANDPNYLRLAPGATIDALRRAYPAVTFTPLREHVRPRGAAAVAVLVASTGLLMLVAWVQVSSLLLARSAGRAPEMGVRLALGATRRRVARQFATEALVIAAASLALGWLATPALVRVIVSLLPPELTIGQVIATDARTFAFAGFLSVVGVVIVALAPLDVLRRSSPLGLLRGTLFGDAGTSAVRLRTSLLIGQLALTTVLLYMAGLAFRSFQEATTTDVGFSPDHVLAFRLPPTNGNLIANATPTLLAYIAGQRQRFAETIPRLRAMPGVVAAGGGRIPLVADLFNGAALRPIQMLASRDGQSIDAYYSRVTSQYAAAVGLRIREGRAFVPGDSEGSVLINETMARRLAAFGPVIGQRLATTYNAYEVIGVFDDMAISHPDESPAPEMLAFWRDQFFSSVVPTIVVRVRGPEDETAVIKRMQAMLAEVFPAEPPRRIIRLSDEVHRATGEHRARLMVLGMIGLLCLPLAAAGVGGALLHAVRQRTREIGVRLALGAEARDIQRPFLAQAFTCVGVGLTVGLAASFAIGRWMSAYLYGVRAIEPWTIVVVALALATVGGLSGWWPAYRASTIDPSVVLREG